MQFIPAAVKEGGRDFFRLDKKNDVGYRIFMVRKNVYPFVIPIKGGNFMFKDKYLSILGDSLSTYKGVSDDRNINATLFYNRSYYEKQIPLEKTYWMRLIDRLGLKLCVNNSYSGGTLSVREIEDSGINRVHHLSRDDGTEPDYIIIFMGVNDLGFGVDAEVFAKDYKEVLMTIKEKYPSAKVCCVNLPDRANGKSQRTLAFNRAIYEAVSASGENFFIADFYSSKVNNDVLYDNTLDGLHPDEKGMELIFDLLLDAFVSNLS